MAFDLPTTITPTPPASERPFSPIGVPGGAQTRAQAQPYAAPAEDHFSSVLDTVHGIWSNALDEPAPAQDQAPVATPFHDDLQTGSSVQRWAPVAEQVSRASGVPKDVTMALIHSTSKGDPAAQLAGGKAVGIAAVPVAHFGPGQDPNDPATNLGVALGQLKNAYQRTGDWDKAALAVTGYGDQNGNPRVIGNGVDGFKWTQQFQAARRRYGGS